MTPGSARASRKGKSRLFAGARRSGPIRRRPRLPEDAAAGCRWPTEKLTMTPEATDKSDAMTTIAVNGPRTAPWMSSRSWPHTSGTSSAHSLLVTSVAVVLPLGVWLSGRAAADWRARSPSKRTTSASESRRPEVGRRERQRSLRRNQRRSAAGLSPQYARPGPTRARSRALACDSPPDRAARAGASAPRHESRRPTSARRASGHRKIERFFNGRDSHGEDVTVILPSLSD